MNYNQDPNQINDKGHLEIDGLDAVELANQYGTPLLIYNLSTVRDNINKYKRALRKYPYRSGISYASKAFSSLAMYQIIAQEDVSIDVVSGGELYLAKQAGFPSKQINFHGNNKSKTELMSALDYNIGYFIVDNFHELDMLNELTKERKQMTKVLIRVTPGVDADTHKHILTGNVDSKFGFDLQSGQAEKAVRIAMEAEYLQLDGLHMHIGSQIFESDSYILAMTHILDYVIEWNRQFNFTLDIFNIGGGFGIQHIPDKQEKLAENQLEEIGTELTRLFDEIGLPYPELWIEPGRSIVGEAGTTIYELGSQKVLPDVRHYIAVDGGMADNLRPALYGAEYYAKVANRMNAKPQNTVSIAGKACESGDMLIWDLELPEIEVGDKLAVFNTGDYSFAMASNYNRLTKPAVVFVENGKHFLAIRRETPEDFMRFEERLPKDF